MFLITIRNNDVYVIHRIMNSFERVRQSIKIFSSMIKVLFKLPRATHHEAIVILSVYALMRYCCSSILTLALTSKLSDILEHFLSYDAMPCWYAPGESVFAISMIQTLKRFKWFYESIDIQMIFITKFYQRNTESLLISKWNWCHRLIIVL